MRPSTTLVVAALIVCACTGEARDDSARQTADTARHTTADFQALRYLEGDWRGSGSADGPFFETYRFVDDSTLEMTGWTDSTMTAAGERSRYLLRDGVIGTDDGARLARVDDEGHHFQRGSSAWTFRQVGPDRWTARVGNNTTYTMDRIVR
jgi:hypothetical protein